MVDMPILHVVVFFLKSAGKVLAHPPGYQRHNNPVQRKHHVIDIKKNTIASNMAKAQTIAERIQAARAKEDFSREEAAKVWGFSKRTLEAWEQGLRNPAGLYLEKLEGILRKAGV